jgi:hypothetical protein
MEASMPPVTSKRSSYRSVAALSCAVKARSSPVSSVPVTSSVPSPSRSIEPSTKRSSAGPVLAAPASSMRISILKLSGAPPIERSAEFCDSWKKSGVAVTRNWSVARH